MKILTTILGLLFVMSVAMDCHAQRQNRGKRQNQGQRQNQAQGQQRDQQTQQDSIDPSALAKRMMEQFDNNDNQQLDAEELAEMFASLQQVRGRRGGMQDGQQQGRRGQRRQQSTEGTAPGLRRQRGNAGPMEEEMENAEGNSQANAKRARKRGDDKKGKGKRAQQGDDELGVSGNSGGVAPVRPGKDEKEEQEKEDDN